MKVLGRFVAVLLALALLLPETSAAQSGAEWKFEATLYAYLPDIGGRVTFPPTGAGNDMTVDVNTILDHLKFAFMGSFEARRGQWGAFTDFLYMDVGNVQEHSQALSIGHAGIPADVNANLSFDLKTSAWSLAGTYAVIASPEFRLDVLAGTRVLALRPKLNWGLSGNVGQFAPIDQAGTRELTEQNWDFIAGAKGRVDVGANGKWFIPYYFDIGTGESKLTDQAMAGIGYGFGWGDVTVSWRYVGYQFKSGGLIEDLTFNGPQFAATFRW